MPKNTATKKRQKKLPARFNILAAAVFIAFSLLTGLVVYFSRAAGSTYNWNPTTGKITGRMFSADAPINQVIPGDVRYAADGQTRLQAAGTPGALSLLDWAGPIFDTNSSAPQAKIFCWIYACDAITAGTVPVPNGVFPQTGGDHHLAIVDNSTRKLYDFWIWGDCTFRFNLVGANWCPASASVADIDGNGIGATTNVSGIPGGIRTYEIEQGYIDHALGFATGTTCKRDPYYPATTSDGTNTNQATCMPIGTRWQLDPSVNVDAIPGITAMEKMIAKALQKYGAYAGDTSGIFGFGIELDRTGTKVYQRAGAPDADYFPLSKIPWDKFKMIEPQWNRDGSKAYSWGNAAPPPVSQAPVPIAPVGSSSSGGSAKPRGGSSSGSGQIATGGGSGSSPSQSSEASPSPSTTFDARPIEQKIADRTVRIAKLTAKVVSSLFFINHSKVTWQKVDGATNYQVRINAGSLKTTSGLDYSWWHFSTGTQQISVQGMRADGSYVGEEETATLKPVCSWYGICR